MLDEAPRRADLNPLGMMEIVASCVLVKLLNMMLLLQPSHVNMKKNLSESSERSMQPMLICLMRSLQL